MDQFEQNNKVAEDVMTAQDRWIQQRLESDKVLEGLLQDIGNSLERIAGHFESLTTTIVPVHKADMTPEMRKELMDQIDEKYKSGILPSEPGHEFENDVPVKEHGTLPVPAAEHEIHWASKDGQFAKCGAFRTPARGGRPRQLTNDHEAVTCPECRKLLKEIEDS